MNEDLSSLGGFLREIRRASMAFVEVLRKNELPLVVRSFHNHIKNYVKATLPGGREQNFLFGLLQEACFLLVSTTFGGNMTNKVKGLDEAA